MTHDLGQMIVGRGKLKIEGQLSDKLMKRTEMVPTTIHSRLMEQIIVAVNHEEPVLLVGETGTGKTSCIQYCAARTGHRLRVVNMSRQSQASDLLGSYRPVDSTTLMRPIFASFHFLMNSTYSSERNERFLATMGKALFNGQIKDVVLPGMKQILPKGRGSILIPENTKFRFLSRKYSINWSKEYEQSKIDSPTSFQSEKRA